MLWCFIWPAANKSKKLDCIIYKKHKSQRWSKSQATDQPTNHYLTRTPWWHLTKHILKMRCCLLNFKTILLNHKNPEIELFDTKKDPNLMYEGIQYMKRYLILINGNKKNQHAWARSATPLELVGWGGVGGIENKTHLRCGNYLISIRMCIILLVLLF